jgi:malonate-semialdehyde dehydrogenase (acetylating)/methylmalonate-semialdehyde dehydrogenase
MSSTRRSAFVSGRVGLSTDIDVDDAVKIAKKAFPLWADTPPIRRARLMNKLLALFNARKDDLARTITAELGKVFSDARGEVQRAIDVIEFSCGIPQLLKGDFTDQVSTGIDNWTFRQRGGARNDSNVRPKIRRETVSSVAGAAKVIDGPRAVI